MCCRILLHHFIHYNKRDNFHACWTYCCCLCLPLLINVCKLPRVALQDSSWQEFAVTVWCFCQITFKCRRKQHEDDESEICSEPTSPSEISIWSQCCLKVKSLRWNVFLGWKAGRDPQHHLILLFLCLSFIGKNEGENSSRNKFFSCLSVALTFINGCLEDWSSNTTPDGRKGLLPIERSIEQLYHKSLDPAVVSMLT